MKLSEVFQSDYLRAADLNNQSVTVKISNVEMKELGTGRDKETKLVLSFHGKKKQLVCNKTNAGTVAKLYGDDTDLWIDKPIILAPREVEFQGDMVWAIRVSLQKPGQPAATPPSHGMLGKPASRPAPAAPAEPEPEPEPAEPIDDVPF